MRTIITLILCLSFSIASAAEVKTVLCKDPKSDNLDCHAPDYYEYLVAENA